MIPFFKHPRILAAGSEMLRKAKMMVAVVALATFCRTSAVYPQTNTRQATKTAAEQRLDERVPIWLKAFNVTGTGIAFIEHGRIAWTAFYGDQFYGGPKANPTTLYSVASLTKPITAEIVLRLAAAGKLSLDEPIWPYWTDPDVGDNPWNKLLTPRLCLSHQTEFTNWRYQTKNTLQFQWEPGTRFGYSGEGFDYLGHFIEKKLDTPFEVFGTTICIRPLRHEKHVIHSPRLVKGPTSEAN